LQKHLNFIV